MQLPKIQKYRDYREMLEKQKDIDAVIIATPDHMHAAIAVAAMDAGKHVYVQKPLCWSVDEARVLSKKAKDNPKLVTQMGNQGHSRDEARLGYEYITSGAIGEVREVHVWTNRPLGYWPQGVPRPGPLPARLQDPATANARWRGRRRRGPRRRRASRQLSRPPISSRGTCSSAWRRRWTTTRSITRSTGAAGWTGARARSATWARTSSTIRSGR